MAFETLKSALGQEFLAKQQFGRETPERELRIGGEKLNQKIVKTNLFQSERKRQAAEKINQVILQLDSTPISSLSDKLSPEHVKYLSRVEELNDPEALRTAENRVKFDVVTRENPELLKDAAIAFPELGSQISGLTTAQETGARQSLIKTEYGQRKELSGQEEIQARGMENLKFAHRLAEIDRQGKYLLQRISASLRTGRGESDPKIKVAQDAIDKLLAQLDAFDPEEPDPQGRLKILEDRINAYTKFINDYTSGNAKKRREAELPNVETLQERLLPDDVSSLFAPEE